MYKRQALAELGAKNDKIVVMDADLAHATMTNMFQAKFPDRHFNFGIAEANMVCGAAGFATEGYVPFVLSLIHISLRQPGR